MAAAEELSEYEVKANYRTLGPLFGKDMPLAAQAIAALDPARVAQAVPRGRNGRAGRRAPGQDSGSGSRSASVSTRSQRRT